MVLASGAVAAMEALPATLRDFLYGFGQYFEATEEAGAAALFLSWSEVGGDFSLCVFAWATKGPCRVNLVALLGRGGLIISCDCTGGRGEDNLAEDECVDADEDCRCGDGASDDGSWNGTASYPKLPVAVVVWENVKKPSGDFLPTSLSKLGFFDAML